MNHEDIMHHQWNAERYHEDWADYWSEEDDDEPAYEQEEWEDFVPEPEPEPEPRYQRPYNDAPLRVQSIRKTDNAFDISFGSCAPLVSGVRNNNGKWSISYAPFVMDKTPTMCVSSEFYNRKLKKRSTIDENGDLCGVEDNFRGQQRGIASKTQWFWRGGMVQNERGKAMGLKWYGENDDTLWEGYVDSYSCIQPSVRRIIERTIDECDQLSRKYYDKSYLHWQRPQGFPVLATA